VKQAFVPRRAGYKASQWLGSLPTTSVMGQWKN
jgi:hypothetical protein